MVIGQNVSVTDTPRELGVPRHHRHCGGPPYFTDRNSLPETPRRCSHRGRLPRRRWQRPQRAALRRAHREGHLRPPRLRLRSTCSAGSESYRRMRRGQKRAEEQLRPLLFASLCFPFNLRKYPYRPSVFCCHALCCLMTDRAPYSSPLGIVARNPSGGVFSKTSTPFPATRPQLPSDTASFIV